ncbi:MAG TPA: hypothetical protein VK563_17220 [Puia sp.]|nr:hypothetical protein [Puia sp.]
MKQLSGAFLTGLLIMLSFYACKKEEKSVSPPVPGNEFLTTVRLVATNTADATDVQVATITDTTLIANPPDSINHPELKLRANSSYNVQVLFLDETKKPAGNVTDDIYDRRNYHLLCFTVAGSATLTVVRTDKDTNNPPLEIGLQDRFTTGAASTGTLNVQLRHQPNAKNGSCDPGSSDADVDFKITIN